MEEIAPDSVLQRARHFLETRFSSLPEAQREKFTIVYDKNNRSVIGCGFGEFNKETEAPIFSKKDSSHQVMMESISSRLAEKVASTSFSDFGGPFSFNALNDRFKNQHTNHKSFQNGNCWIARSSASNFQPIVAKASDTKYKCLPTIMAAGVVATAFATNMISQHMLMITASVTNLINQPIFTLMVMAMGTNFVLGMLREHSQNLSPPWLTSIVLTVPFIPILCSPVPMDKTTMAYTLGASVLAQVLGSMAEQARLRAVAATMSPLHLHLPETQASLGGGFDPQVEVTPFVFDVEISLKKILISLHVSSLPNFICMKVDSHRHFSNQNRS